MAFPESITGQKSSWSLFKKLGEGDAGEVYLVESLLEKKAAILKRPHRSAFSSDVIRQASQIEAEGKILRALENFRLNGASFSLETPALLDQGPAGTEFSERFFIVVAKAPGFDLKSLARAARFGRSDPDDPANGLPQAEKFFLDHLARREEIPVLVLLRALSGVIELLEKIHTYRASGIGSEQTGLIWNDIKPEHIFWDPGQRRFTIIDWGNSQILEADGATKDRRNSRLDDYAQFVQDLGKFLADASPDLHARLEWPANILLSSDYPEAVMALKERVIGLLYEEQEGLRDARQEEEILSISAAPLLEQLQELERIQDRIVTYGEMPDFSSLEKFCSRLAARLASESRLDEFKQICKRSGEIPCADPEKWLLLGQLSEIAAQSSAAPRQILLHALIAGVHEDWAGVLWDLVSIVQDQTPPPWWDELSGRVRRMQLGSSSDGLTPFVTASRLVYTLQASLQRLPGVDAEKMQSYENMVRVLREDVVRKWNQVEPDPPDSGLEYQDIDRWMERIGELAPEQQHTLTRLLDQPRAQVKIILEAWGRKDFETARRGLRHLLLWDPDRRRVLVADRALQSTPAWLEKVYLGPKKGELQDFMTEMELSGRELRNQVGPARWLDLILEAFAGLRKGSSPADLIAEHPGLLNEVFWLNDYDSRRPAPQKRTEPVRLEREPGAQGTEPLTGGVKEGALGPEGELLLTDSLDTWAPEARGSSARVFLGFLKASGGNLRQSAIKLMRPDRAEYALPLFREEIQILTLMREVPGISGMLECGYIRLDDGQDLPPDDRPASARGLSGSVLRYGVHEVRDFLVTLDSRVEQGWLPYLAMEKHDREDNLMALCDAGYTHGRFLPVEESLCMALQILDILQVAHARNIVYRDHKILHYYWQEVYNGIFMIDWNVARRHPQGLSSAEKQFDLVQFGARALHHILTGRPAPGALPLGPTRPEEIEQASRTYPVRWTYDDQRLPAEVKSILERVLAGGYTSAKELRDDLYNSFVKVNGNG